MKQVGIKEVLMQSKEFRNAYMELKGKLHEGAFWFMDSLEIYPETIPVFCKPEYRVKYGDFWLVFAKLLYPEKFPGIDEYGCVVVDEVLADDMSITIRKLFETVEKVSIEYYKAYTCENCGCRHYEYERNFKGDIEIFYKLVMENKENGIYNFDFDTVLERVFVSRGVGEGVVYDDTEEPEVHGLCEECEY